MKKIIALLALSAGFLFNSCGEKKEEQTQGTESTAEISNKDKQLNITLLLDLSDRIEPSKYPATPSHEDRDIAAVKEVLQIFKEEMKAKGNFKMKGKLKVLFSPVPQNPEINQIAKQLNIDTEILKPAEKTALYKNVENDFLNNLKAIYETTLQSKNYIGSDVWRFFKNDIRELAEQKDPHYKNIVIIITDGYLYHDNTKMNEGNRYSYILPELVGSKNLNDSNWEQKIDDSDFGLMNARTNKDLENIEVLVLELNPAKKNYEEDILNKVLSKWFKEMGVSKFSIYQTDIPENTKTKIRNFFN